ncbi:MAG: coproporphyrinogen III oxidase family protein [Thermoflexales bacterium]|nr:coproporphyrinogen III oxidase family protein [Thermoflexales bacterium]
MIAEHILTTYLEWMNRFYFRLEPAQATTLPRPRPGRDYMLYLHVPFCRDLCPYCSFNRFVFQEAQARAYFKRLREEMRMAARLGYTFPALYIGGGTPTILLDELCQTIDLARELFHIREVSCETNPNHLTAELVSRLQGRVQRLSVGAQSFDDGLLKQMNRYHTIGPGQATLEHIQAAAGCFPSLNIDMIFNFPRQSEAILRRDIELVLRSGANQVTFYPLMAAPSVKRSLTSALGKVNTSSEARYYQIISDELGQAFEPMSAWTWAHKSGGLIDEYIVDYEDYVGLGSGSFSYLDGDLYVNTFSLRDYERAIGAGRMSLAATRRFGLGDRMRYRFLMELFGLNLDKRRFRHDFGISLERGLWQEMAFMTAAGAFARSAGETLRLTPRGRYLMVVIMREFFCGVNILRDRARQGKQIAHRKPQIAKKYQEVHP